VTNLNKQSTNVVKFYNGRGTAEQWIKEGKNAVKWTKLSCRTFKDNQTRLQLFALAYNLANFLRRLALQREIIYGEAAIRKNRSASEPVRLELQFKEATGAGQLHVLAVGVNRFAEESINLRFAAPDARAVAEIFQKREPTLYGGGRVQITQLLDDRATTESVFAALADVSAKAKPQGTFCLFLAGHGTMVGQRSINRRRRGRQGTAETPHRTSRRRRKGGKGARVAGFRPGRGTDRHPRLFRPGAVHPLYRCRIEFRRVTA